MSDHGRAVLFHGDRRLELAEFPVVDPDPDGLTVKVTRANVCGSDVHAWLGHFDMTRMGATLPTVLGHEATGTVAALGRNVSTDAMGAPLAVGDRIVFAYYQACGSCRSCVRGRPNACVRQRMAMFGSAAEPPHFVGVFADYFSLGPRATVLKAPETVPDAVLAGANCALAQVVSGFDEVPVGQGDVVVIQGAGGLGLYATAVARDRGAGAVIVVDGNAERLELARRFGATDVVDMTEVPEARDRTRAVRRLTGGWGADVVVEVAGTPHAVPEGLTMVGPHGAYLIMGAVGSTEAVPIAPSRIILGNLTVRGVGFYRPMSLVRAVDFLVRTVDRLPYDALAGEAFPLEKVGDALEAARTQTLARPAIVV
ncbi:zinc-binding dehydrogenase [Pseudonocardia sp. ICBG1122]|nr:zinc-binding dehydrogenase [Pseudonocardia pini]